MLFLFFTNGRFTFCVKQDLLVIVYKIFAEERKTYISSAIKQQRNKPFLFYVMIILLS